MVLEHEGVNLIDSQGAAKLTEIHELARDTGLALHLARVKPHVLAVLRVDGVVELIGAERIHRAVVAHLAHTQ